jgi:hypothetical protein
MDDDVRSQIAEKGIEFYLCSFVELSGCVAKTLPGGALLCLNDHG